MGGFTEIDWRSTTTAFDVIYVRGGARDTAGLAAAGVRDGLYAGVSFVGRPGSGAFNTSLRVLTSMPVGTSGSTRGTTAPSLPEALDPASRGTLVFSEVSWTPHHGKDFFYATGFYALGTYRAAALDRLIPGPLARAAGSGLGDGAALSPEASDTAGGAFGHQMFLAGTRQQLVFEGAARYSNAECVPLLACNPRALARGLQAGFATRPPSDGAACSCWTPSWLAAARRGGRSRRPTPAAGGGSADAPSSS